MNTNLLSLIFTVAMIGGTIYGIYKDLKHSQAKLVIDKFMECIPIIDKTFDKIRELRNATGDEDQICSLTLDYLYEVIADNTTLDDNYPTIVNKDNIRKYILPIFHKIYAIELKK